MSNLRHDNALVDKTAGLARMVLELAAGRPVTAATVLDRDGQAHRLLFAADATVLDGGEGGLLEVRAGEALRQPAGADRLAEWRQGVLLGLLAGDEAEVYGGLDRLVLQRFFPDAATRAMVSALAGALAGGRPGLLVTALETDGPAGRWLCLAGQPPQGDALPAPVLAGAEAALCGADLGPTVLEAAGRRYLLDAYRPLPALFLAGAGRISRLAAPLAAQVGFRVVVLDSSATHANRERFPGAAGVRVVPDFADCFAGETVDADASVVVITRGHVHDLPALRQALATPAGYVGLLACKADGRARLEELGRQGVSPADLARVRTPVGLPIGGKSPAEIALSIVAEAVSARSARRKAKAASGIAARP